MAYDTATLTMMTAVIAGLVCPPLVSLLKQAAWSQQLKHGVSLLVSGAAAVVGMLIDGKINGWHDFDLQWVLTTWASVHAVSQVIYSMYFAGSPWEQRLTDVGAPLPEPAGPAPLPPDHPAYIGDDLPPVKVPPHGG